MGELRYLNISPVEGCDCFLQERRSRNPKPRIFESHAKGRRDVVFLLD